MNSARFWSAVASLVVAGAALAEESVPSGIPITVTLERIGCLGFCPAYTVSISSDGTVTFTGKAWVEKQGLATKKVPEAQLIPLFQRIRDINFWLIDGKSDGRKMQPNGDVIAGYNDSPSYSVTVVEGGRSKQVQGFTGGKYAEGDLADLIDKVADIADWTKRSLDALHIADLAEAAAWPAQPPSAPPKEATPAPASKENTQPPAPKK